MVVENNYLYLFYMPANKMKIRFTNHTQLYNNTTNYVVPRRVMFGLKGVRRPRANVAPKKPCDSCIAPPAGNSIDVLLAKERKTRLEAAAAAEEAAVAEAEANAEAGRNRQAEAERNRRAEANAEAERNRRAEANAEAERNRRAEANAEAERNRRAEANAEAERNRQAEAERNRQAEAERNRQAEAERNRQAEAGRNRQAEAGRNRQAEAERNRQAEAERNRQAEAGRNRQAEAERNRQAEAERNRQAEAERNRQAEAERNRQAEAERNRQAEAERNRQAEAEDKRQKQLVVEEVTPGDGKTFPKAGDRLRMHYTGTLMSDDSKFDSSRDRGEPFEFTIGQGQVIAGWDKGIMRMSVGERALLKIPASEGYGARGAGGVIPPDADLVFDVELLAINSEGSNPPAEAKVAPVAAAEPPKEDDELGVVFEKSVVTVLTDNFETGVMQKDKDVLLLLYAPWCGWCKKIAPDYIKATEMLASNSQVELMAVDATQWQTTHPKVQVQGFPTAFLFKKGDKANPVEYNGDRSANDLVKFVNTHRTGKA